eukprot:7716082-Pyramimonas_sp.AAC.1
MKCSKRRDDDAANVIFNGIRHVRRTSKHKGPPEYSLRFAYPHQPFSKQQLLRNMPAVVFFRRVSACPRISP